MGDLFVNTDLAGAAGPNGADQTGAFQNGGSPVQAPPASRASSVLAAYGFSTERELVNYFSSRYNLPVADLKKLQSTPAARQFVTANYALSNLVLPIDVDDTCFQCVIADPVDLLMIDNLRRATSKRLVMSVGAPTALFEAIAKAYRVPSALHLAKFLTSNPMKSKRRRVTPAQVDRARLLKLLAEVA